MLGVWIAPVTAQRMMTVAMDIPLCIRARRSLIQMG